MFARKENILPHFETIVKVDLGTDVNWVARATLEIVTRLMNYNTMDINEEHAKILRGAKINTGLDAEDFHIVSCLDLQHIQVSDYGKAELIDYLADYTKEWYWLCVIYK